MGRSARIPFMSTPASDIAQLRKSYEKAELNEDASHADPLRQFEQWLQEAIAAEVPEPKPAGKLRDLKDPFAN